MLNEKFNNSNQRRVNKYDDANDDDFANARRIFELISFLLKNISKNFTRKSGVFFYNKYSDFINLK